MKGDLLGSLSDNEDALFNSYHHAAHSSPVAGFVGRVGAPALPNTTVLFGSTSAAAATTATPAGANTAATGLAATAAAGDTAACNVLGRSPAVVAVGAMCGSPVTSRRCGKIRIHGIVPRSILNLRKEVDWSR